MRRANESWSVAEVAYADAGADRVFEVFFQGGDWAGLEDAPAGVVEDWTAQAPRLSGGVAAAAR